MPAAGPVLLGPGSDLGDEAQRHAIDAMPVSGRLRAVIEDMAEMTAATPAQGLGPHHHEGAIGLLDNGVGQRLIEARPAGAALELRLRREQRQVAAAQAKVPLRFSLFSGLVKGRSVPASRRTLYWAGESCFFHSAGVFSISNFSVVFSPALALPRPSQRKAEKAATLVADASRIRRSIMVKAPCTSENRLSITIYGPCRQKLQHCSSGLLTFTRAHGRRGHLTAITPANRRYSRSGARPAPVVVHGRRRMLPRNRSLRLG